MKQRNTTIDAMRLLMAFGVISIHVKFNTAVAEGYYKFFWPIAVPFFYVSSLAFFINGLNTASVSGQIKKAYERIVIPYLCWTGIYVFLLLIKGSITGHYQSLVWWRVLFYGESAVQLYFLPDLLCFQALALGLYLVFKKRDIRVGLITLLLPVCYLIIGDVYDCFGVSTSGQYIGVAIYLAGAFLLSSKIKGTSFSYFSTLAGALVVLLVTCFSFLGYACPVMDYPLLLPVGGVGLLLLCIGCPMLFRSERNNQITSSSFGIYLSHILFLEGLEFLTESVFHYNLVYDFWMKTAVVTVVFISSLTLVFFIRKSFFLKRVLLGERSPMAVRTK